MTKNEVRFVAFRVPHAKFSSIAERRDNLRQM